MKLYSVLSVAADSIKRFVVKGWNGKSDTRTAKQYGPYGFDSNPIKNVVALYTRTELDGAEAFLGYLNKGCLTNPGESRVFVTDENGTFKFNIWLKSDGTVLIGSSETPSSYTNFAVMFNELKTEFNSLKSSYNDLVTKVNANAALLGTHTHPYLNASTPSVTSPSGIAGQNGSANTANIDNAKNTHVKYS